MTVPSYPTSMFDVPHFEDPTVKVADPQLVPEGAITSIR
jgi:hypothetical protein